MYKQTTTQNCTTSKRELNSNAYPNYEIFLLVILSEKGKVHDPRIKNPHVAVDILGEKSANK